MRLEIAQELAHGIRNQLAAHCERIEIAGSIRRRKADDIKDVEIVCIPKPYGVGLFRSGIASVIDQWTKVRGDLPCKYTQRRYEYFRRNEEGETLRGKVNVDIFFATPENWGLILAIRTGSAEYSHHVLAHGWVKKGYHSKDGVLINDRGNKVSVAEEADLYRLIGLQWISPDKRNL